MTVTNKVQRAWSLIKGLINVQHLDKENERERDTCSCAPASLTDLMDRYDEPDLSLAMLLHRNCMNCLLCNALPCHIGRVGWWKVVVRTCIGKQPSRVSRVLHWEKVLVVVTHFFCKKGSQVYFFILYYLYTLVLITRLIK